MKKILVIALFASILNHTAYAQFSLGLKTGVNFPTAHTTDVLNQATPDFHAAPGWTAGAVAEWSFGDYFALQPEFNWVQKGFAWNESAGIPIGGVDIPFGAEATFRTNYLELPLLAKLKLGNARLQGYVVAGPTVGYALDAKIITRPRLLFEFDPVKTPVDLDDLDYQRLEVSATGGLGFQLNFDAVKILADARYTHGFTELYDFPVVNEKISNRGIALSAGVLFNLQPAPAKVKKPGPGRPTQRR